MSDFEGDPNFCLPPDLNLCHKVIMEGVEEGNGVQAFTWDWFLQQDCVLLLLKILFVAFSWG